MRGIHESWGRVRVLNVLRVTAHGARRGWSVMTFSCYISDRSVAGFEFKDLTQSSSSCDSLHAADLPYNVGSLATRSGVPGSRT
jgi:hypothetical protein